MKPFDLERARAGDPVVYLNGAPTHFVGLSSSGYPVIETHGLTSTVFTTDLRMAPKKTTYYVNIHRDVFGVIFCGSVTLTSSEAGCIAETTRGTHIKTISFEVEE
jgi:predicted nuclease with RNAse H fold